MNKRGDGMATEAQKRAVLKYDTANTTQLHLKLNNKTDADILAWLAQQENVQGYIKKLIREDVEGIQKKSALPYLCEEVIEIDDGSEGHSFYKYCPKCKTCFGWFYPPKYCPSCGQWIDKEHGEMIGTRTVDNRTNKT